MRTLPALLLPALLLASSACGGGGDDPKALVDAGAKAMGNGDYSGAAAKFEAALPALDPASDQWGRAKKGLIEALAHTQPEVAADELLALSEERELKLDDYCKVATVLVEGQQDEPAQRVIRAAWAAYPDTMALKLLGLEALAAQKASGAGGTEGLADLGYTSGGDPEEALEDPKNRELLAAYLGLDALD